MSGEASLSAVMEERTWGSKVAWTLLGIFLVIVIALVIWWIVAVTLPKRAKDQCVRDLSARGIAASGNVCIGSHLNVGGLTTEAAALIRALSLPPVTNANHTIVLDGTQTSIVLTQTSALPATVAAVGLGKRRIVGRDI